MTGSMTGSLTGVRQPTLAVMTGKGVSGGCVGQAAWVRVTV
jgi:hypothetical protein